MKDVPESVNIAQIVKRVIKEMSILAQKNGVTICLKIKKPKISTILIDALRFQEVIENLLANAVSYSQASGTVIISIDQKDGWVSITVKDTGIGISSQDQRKIFTKFFRAENAVAKDVEGSGLGLYVVKTYVEGWGGKVQVKSRIDKGSIFRVLLPVKMNHKKLNKRRRKI